MSFRTGPTASGRPHAAAVLLPAVLLAGGLLVSGCAAGPAATGTPDHHPGSARAAADASSPHGAAAGHAAPEAQTLTPAEIPGLGPATRGEISDRTSQAVVVTGATRDSNTDTVLVYERDPDTGWHPVTGRWPAHNALNGWTEEHHQGDLRSPIGVYGLTDAGGKLPDPGTRLPYDRGPAFTVSGVGSRGEPLAGSFDYVVAINYNRRPGTTPLDWTRPLGAERGGGIWIHVDHGGPTEGCVSLPRERIKELMRMLDPRRTPVVIMGDRASLAR